MGINTEGQSGAGAGDGNQADRGADSEVKKDQSGPQQEAAAQAEAERKNDSYLTGLEAGEKASDELHKPWENSLDVEKAAEKREQIEAAKRIALTTCGQGCAGHERDFSEAFDSGYGDRERGRAIDGMVKTAVYVGLASAGSPKNSVGAGEVKPPTRTKSPPPSQGNSSGGTQTPPTLPQKQIASDGKVTIEHYYRSGDHPPAHAHVKGGGPDTKIGPNGKPVKGHPELTAAQRAVVEQNKSTIRKAVNKIGKWLKSIGDD